MQSLAPSKSLLDRGERFTLSGTVRNIGDATAAATVLRYERETGSSWTLEATSRVGALSGSQASSEPVDIAAPGEAGTYAYRACVAAVSGESDGTNNCSNVVRVTVRAGGGPDLVVESAAATPAVVDPGERFMFSARVRNRGDGGAAATTLRYERQAGLSWMLEGTAPVRSLAASQAMSQSRDIAAPGEAGTYAYRACVAAVSGESDGTNNCSNVVRVTVRAGGGPDLVVESAAATPAVVDPGERFMFSARVRNRGDGGAAATTLRYERQAGLSWMLEGTAPVRSLAASQAMSQSRDIAAPGEAGTYAYRACVAAVSGESDGTNNCSNVVRVTVRAGGGPDLVVESAAATPAVVDPGERFMFSARVRNRGDGGAAATTLRYERQAGLSWMLEGTAPVRSLAASQAMSQSRDIAAPGEAGTYAYRACVAAVSGESDGTNNCSNVVRVTVRAGGPDLALEITILSHYNLLPGEAFVFGTTVVNQGDGGSAATTVSFQRRLRGGPWADVGRNSVGSLLPSESSRESVRLTAPEEEGFYQFQACVSPVAGESDETNNCSPWVDATVSADARNCTYGLGPVSGTVVRFGEWIPECRSAHYGGFARYYSFAVRGGGAVEVSLSTGNLGTVLALWTGGGMGQELVAADTGDLFDPFHVYRINQTLMAGTYTVEARNSSPILGFNLTLSVEDSPSNRGPQRVGTLPPLTLGVNDAAVTVEVSGAFRDPDGDRLTYGASSSAPPVARVAVSGSLVTVTPLAEGTALATVTATDIGGSNTAAAQRFVVTVSPPANQPPEPVGTLAPVTIRVDERPVTVEVSGTFRDPDGDRLTYGASSSSPSVASVLVSGSRVTVTPMATGAATVTVTATDTAGSNTPAVQRFGVTVSEGCTNDLGRVSGRLTRTGSWTGDCSSVHYPGRYARYYSFRLLRRSAVRIDLMSSTAQRSPHFIT